MKLTVISDEIYFLLIPLFQKNRKTIDEKFTLLIYSCEFHLLISAYFISKSIKSIKE